MAKSTATAGINAFAAATRKPTATTSKKKGNIVIARDIDTYAGVHFPRIQVAEAINSYIEGHNLFEQGKALKDLHRSTIIGVAYTEQAIKWMNQGARPDNPKMYPDPDASSFISVVIQDSVNKLDDNKYAALANLIGPAAAEASTVRRDDFSINPDSLGLTCKFVIDGKTQEATVLEALGMILDHAFAPSPQILQGLFQVNPVFTTKKGLIDEGKTLTGNAQKLAQFLEAGHFVTQLRPGGGKSDE